MRRHTGLLAFALVSMVTSSVLAQIYRGVDEHGNVVFTDEPHGSNAKPVDLKPMSTYTAPDYKTRQKLLSDTPKEGGVEYQQLEIQSPGQEETIRENAGTVQVRATIQPQLSHSQGHLLQFYLDGEAAGKPSRSSAITLTEVVRGEHSITVAVVDSSGKKIKDSLAVRFFLHRQSINFPTRVRPTPR